MELAATCCSVVVTASSRFFTSASRAAMDDAADEAAADADDAAADAEEAVARAAETRPAIASACSWAAFCRFRPPQSAVPTGCPQDAHSGPPLATAGYRHLGCLATRWQHQHRSR